MDRKPVESSNLKAVGYDEAVQLLEVEFHSAEIWQYSSVPKREYDALISAPSKGKYFDRHIKGNFTEQKVKGNEYDRVRQELTNKRRAAVDAQQRSGMLGKDPFDNFRKPPKKMF